VGPQLAERLAKIDVFSPADLILHLPLRYEDETRLTMLADVRPGVPAQCEVEVLSCEVTPPPRRQLVARARDASGEVMLRFVHFYPSSRSSWPPAAGCASLASCATASSAPR
jgi:ATP-dependent DNA helicase RecG